MDYIQPITTEDKLHEQIGSAAMLCWVSAREIETIAKRIYDSDYELLRNIAFKLQSGAIDLCPSLIESLAERSKLNVETKAQVIEPLSPDWWDEEPGKIPSRHSVTRRDDGWTSDDKN